MKKFTLVHDYAVSPARLWALVTDYDALAKVMAGKITFDGLPEGRTRAGQRIDVMVSLFGRLPPQPYHMHVLSCDDTARELRSSEKGAGVRSWHHHLAVTQTQGGSRLTETLEIDAGWLTWAFVLWAKHLYGARHQPRLALLESGAY